MFVGGCGLFDASRVDTIRLPMLATRNDPRTDLALALRGARWSVAGLLVIAAGVASADETKPPANEVKPLAGEAKTTARQSKEIRDYKPATAEEKRAALEMLRSGITDSQLFDNYFNFVLSQFTWEESRPALHTLRKNLKSHLRTASNQAAHDQINQLALALMKPIALDAGFHHTVRVNAALVIGDLNQQEVPLGAIGDPVPLPATRQFLLELVTNKDRVTDVDDALRITALNGILRHAQDSDMPEAERNRIVEIVTALVQEKQAPKGRDARVHAWIRRSAAQVLEAVAQRAGGVRSPDEIRVVAEMLADRDSPLTVRCDAARIVGTLDLRGVDTAIRVQLGRMVGQLALDVVKAESTARSLKSRLEDVRTALKGSNGGQGTERGLATNPAQNDKPFFDQLTERIDAVLAPMDHRRAQEADVVQQVKQKAGELETWLRGQQGEVAGAIGGVPPATR